MLLFLIVSLIHEALCKESCSFVVESFRLWSEPHNDVIWTITRNRITAGHQEWLEKLRVLGCTESFPTEGPRRFCVVGVWAEHCHESTQSPGLAPTSVVLDGTTQFLKCFVVCVQKEGYKYNSFSVPKLGVHDISRDNCLLEFFICWLWSGSRLVPGDSRDLALPTHTPSCRLILCSVDCIIKTPLCTQSAIVHCLI